MANTELMTLAAMTGATARDSKEFDKLGISPSNFTEFSAEANFCFTHRQKFGKWPSKKTLRRLFPSIILPKVREPLAFYGERLVERSAFNKVSRLLVLSNAILESRKPGAAYDALSKLRDGVLGIADSHGASNDQDWSAQSLARLKEYAHRKTTISKNYIDTPWDALNRLIIGFDPGSLTTLAARYAVGKTFILLYLAHHAWMKGKRILIFSNEMTAEKLALRLDCISAKVSWPRFLRGDLQPKQFARYKKAMLAAKSCSGKIFLVEDAALTGLTPSVVSARISQYNPDIVMIDGAYLMDTGNANNLVQGLVVLSRTMKRLARIRRVPIIQVHQINRSGEKKSGGGHGTIAWSDAVEQDSDLIFEIVGDRAMPTRIFRVLKGRDSGCGEFSINYRMSPRIDFSENVSGSVQVPNLGAVVTGDSGGWSANSSST